MTRALAVTIITLALAISCIAQVDMVNKGEPYSIDVSGNRIALIQGHLKLGSNRNPGGDELNANSLYFTRNGKPWFPVMGEFHFSRYPRDQWEESILKMKACGIDVIATYVFWIYHEESEGVWDWTGNKDLKYFTSLCAKHHMYLFLRIGPWCHGEVRNGGFPDWLLAKGIKTRRNDSTYLQYVGKLFSQIHQQLNGYYFKEGGNVIGTQIENEYRFNNPAGLAHMLTLKKMATDAGIDVPYYTATGWPGSDLKQNELVPVWGAYPEAPWDKRTDKLKPSENYLFGSLRSDPAIGSDLLGKAKDATNYAGYRYPYATAEMGGGNEITYHRRPIIESDDVTALAYVKTGSGANLMGYYMFHGGSNAKGKLSTLQESKATKYPNDYPIISYDFYAPIGEFGQLRPSYRAFKRFHLFLNDFGDKLVQTTASFPANRPKVAEDANILRWSVRSNDKSGFIFISNFERQEDMHDIEGVQFRIKTSDGILTIPQKPVTIKRNLQVILPFKFDMEGITLQYATAQLLCKLDNKEDITYVFFEPEGLKTEYVFDKIQSVIRQDDLASVIEQKGQSVRITQPGMRSGFILVNKNGRRIRVLTLTNQQALNAWKAIIAGKERLFISANDLMFAGDSIIIRNTGTVVINLDVYPSFNSLDLTPKGSVNKKQNGLLTDYSFTGNAKVRIINAIEDKGLYSPGKSDSTGKGSMPLYGPVLTSIPGAKYWKIRIPNDALDSANDAFLKFDYSGDTFAAYLDGKLIADDFYAGLPAVIGLKRFGRSILGKELTVLITPLNREQKVYFEDKVARPSEPTCRSVSLVSEYQTLMIPK